MKLVPSDPPARAARKARAFALEMCELRAQGYTFEAIRQALAAVGVHVSNPTVQREIARAAKSRVTSVAAFGTQQAALLAGEAPTRRAPGSPRPPGASADGRPLAALRNGKEIAEAFASRHITNPLVRAKRIAKDVG